MLNKTRGIVLRTIPYNDKYSIIHIYTEAFGRVSYLVGRPGKRSKVSKALFIPLSPLEMEVEHMNKRDLQRIKETRMCFSINDICRRPIKNVLALFLSEILFQVMKEYTEPDKRLFSYLYESIHLLEYTDKGIANFHLVFLLGLPRFLGISPNTESYQTGSYFDMLNGVFTSQVPTHRHYLNKEESAFFSRLLRIRYENMSLYSFSRQDRTRIIQHILEYYRLHLPDFPEIKSLPILQSLFDD